MSGEPTNTGRDGPEYPKVTVDEVRDEYHVTIRKEKYLKTEFAVPADAVDLLVNRLHSVHSETDDQEEQP